VVESGPLRVSLELVRRWRHSCITQRIHAYQHTTRIDFDTEVDWHEHHILLKAAFPAAIHSTSATYEIQFGALERPTHWNTSWDYARFEVCGHRWADLSEGDYGVSLLNDCKYGHDIKDNVLRLTLIKSATSPTQRRTRGYIALPMRSFCTRVTGAAKRSHRLPCSTTRPLPSLRAVMALLPTCRQP